MKPKKLKEIGEMTVQGEYSPMTLPPQPTTVTIHFTGRDATGREVHHTVERQGYVTILPRNEQAGEPFAEVIITPENSYEV